MGAIASAVTGVVGNVLGNVSNIVGIDKGNKQEQQGYANANGIINQRYDQAANTVKEGYGTAYGNLNAGYDQAGNYLKQGYDLGTSALGGGYNTSRNDITGNYGQAIAGYAPYTGAGGLAANELGNLISSGYASRQFNNQDLYNGLSPNYDFQLNQGQRNAQALANQGGGTISGNALQGLNTFTQNFAGNAYQKAFENFNNQRNSIFGNLQPVADMGLRATDSVGNLYSKQGNALADIATKYGTNMADLGTSYGSSNAGLNVNRGSSLAGLNIGESQNLANLYTGQGNILAENNINAGNRAGSNTMAQYNQGGKALGSMTGSANNLGSALSNIGSFFKLG